MTSPSRINATSSDVPSTWASRISTWRTTTDLLRVRRRRTSADCCARISTLTAMSSSSRRRPAGTCTPAPMVVPEAAANTCWPASMHLCAGWASTMSTSSTPTARMPRRLSKRPSAHSIPPCGQVVPSTPASPPTRPPILPVPRRSLATWALPCSSTNRRTR